LESPPPRFDLFVSVRSTEHEQPTQFEVSLELTAQLEVVANFAAVSDNHFHPVETLRRVPGLRHQHRPSRKRSLHRQSKPTGRTVQYVGLGGLGPFPALGVDDEDWSRKAATANGPSAFVVPGQRVRCFPIRGSGGRRWQNHWAMEASVSASEDQEYQNHDQSRPQGQPQGGVRGGKGGQPLRQRLHGGADPKNRFDPYDRYGVGQLWNTEGVRANAPGRFISPRREMRGTVGRSIGPPNRPKLQSVRKIGRRRNSRYCRGCQAGRSNLVDHFFSRQLTPGLSAPVLKVDIPLQQQFASTG
jgi:hypothetical protein